jgi:hypothetical protein
MRTCRPGLHVRGDAAAFGRQSLATFLRILEVLFGHPLNDLPELVCRVTPHRYLVDSNSLTLKAQEQTD